MKKYLLTQLIFIGLFGQFSEAMDTEQESQKQFSLCKQVLTIDPNAPAADYKALAQRLHEAKLSTCECATYLTHEKNQKALRALKKKGFLSEQDIKRINKFQDEIKKIKEPLNKLVVETNSDLKEDIKKEIIEHFAPNFSPIQFKTNKYDFLRTSAGISYVLPLEFSNFKKALKSVQFEHSLLVLEPDIQKQSSICRKFTYLHEEQHIRNRHDLIDDILSIELIKKSGQKGKNYKSFPYETLQKLYRAQETEADTIPAACGSCDEAYSSVKFFDKSPKDNRKHNGEHPSNRTRYQRAQRIYKLKLAEEKINQKEDPELL